MVRGEWTTLGTGSATTAVDAAAKMKRPFGGLERRPSSAAAGAYCTPCLVDFGLAIRDKSLTVASISVAAQSIKGRGAFVRSHHD